MISSASAADHAVHLASYTTGQNGSRLKWLPFKAADPDGVKQAVATEAVSGPALADPFGDKSKDRAVSPAKLHDSLLDKSAPKLAPARLVADESRSKPAATSKAGQMPSLEVAAGAKRFECPKPEDLKPLRERSVIEAVVPPPGEFPQTCPMVKDTYQGRTWSPTTFTWKASALCSKPAYFEDIQLERYGHTWGPYVQPFLSAGHFFLAVPALPYFMGLYPPQECIYTLGYYRPGSCAPYMLDPLPLSVRAALVEGGVWTGMVFLIP
jgi:hypothetical protein